MDPAQLIGIVIGLSLVALLLLVVFFKTNVITCHPNELVVFSGRQRKLPDGSSVGYRVIRGGRAFKWPIVESVARLPLTTLPVDLRLEKVLCSGMIPVRVEGRASVKLAGREEDGVEYAIERFLGKGADSVAKAAMQALEGAVRGVVATLEPEEANTNRLELAAKVTEQTRGDLRGLGIVLDFFQILEITDEQGYLEAIGKKRNAVVQRDASIAEATAKAESRRVAAEQQRLGREAEIDAELVVVERENALAVRTAELEGDSNQARERASVAGQIARSEAEVELQNQRARLSEKREEADTIVPARARREAARMAAEGASARILEDGKASAEALELLRQQWQDGESRELFLIHLLPELTDKFSRVVSDNLRIDKLTIIDSGEGDGVPGYVNNLTGSVVALLEQLKNATGIDVAKMARGDGGNGGAKLPKQLED